MMTPLSTLWLPILLSAVAVFVASSVIHMASPWHKNDYPRLPNERQVLDALRPLAVPPGDYMMPRPESRVELSSPEFLARMDQGPVVIMTVLPNGPMAMGPTLGVWLLYLIVVATLAALVTGVALRPGADFHDVFHISAVASFTGYAVALWQMSIWYRRSWRTTLKATADGILYALLTAAVFGWLWPR
jgi:hypothetical protein